jgi:hypothetical protein
VIGIHGELGEDEPVRSPWEDVGLVRWLIRGSILGWLHQILGGPS